MRSTVLSRSPVEGRFDSPRPLSRRLGPPHAASLSWLWLAIFSLAIGIPERAAESSRLPSLISPPTLKKIAASIPGALDRQDRLSAAAQNHSSRTIAMTPQEAFGNSWFGISLFGITAAVLLAVGLARLYVCRRPPAATAGLRTAPR